ncbi:MAG: hypothetical protein ACRDID_16715 [Ktedonobacterales bacterium]
MDALSTWHTALAVMVGLLLLAFLLAVFTLWRARRVGALAVVVSTMSALLVIAAEVASVALWLRIRELLTTLSDFTLRLPWACMTPDQNGHFSPPPGYFTVLLHALAQVAPLERAAAVDAAFAVVALATVIACALLWGRRRAPAPQTA